MKKVFNFFIFILFTQHSIAQPNWASIKSNAAFIIHDTSYASPYIQPLNVGGWEDGLYITGDLSFVVVYGDASSTDTTDVYDCDPWFLPKKNQVVTGIHEKLSESHHIKISPNPAEKFITLALPKGNFDVSIYNQQGVKVKHTTCSNKNNTIDCSCLDHGMYYIIANGNGTNYKARIVKQ